MTRIMVSGNMVTKRLNGGEAWVRLNWILGLRRLGVDVVFVEQLPGTSCVDVHGDPTSFERCANLSCFANIVNTFDLSGRAALISPDGSQVYGSTMSSLIETAATCDALINISGHLTLPSIVDRIPLRVFIDEDPGFTQFWHAQGIDAGRLDGYHHYFTVGTNVGQPECSIPVDGILWRPIRQPVVLDAWPVCDSPRHARFTTIASWRGAYGTLTVGEHRFGAKAHEFRRFIELPQRVDAEFEIALDIQHDDDRDLVSLQSHGWRIVDPTAVAPDPIEFRKYIQSSGGEFSVAQGVYVDTNSGWFSDRTVRYLASGKPTLVQNTGFPRSLPVGEGLLTFSTVDQAADGVCEVVRHYQRHAHAARALAETYFDSDRVLADLLDTIHVSA
jgi:hypothetical protein